MAMLTLRIDDELNNRITALAQKTGRTKTYFIKKLLVEAIDDLEDELWAQQAARELLAKRARGEVEETYDWRETMEALKKRDLEDNS
jgi:RHH-type rel operon transcriptional repressor/antitoxin RelB